MDETLQSKIDVARSINERVLEVAAVMDETVGHLHLAPLQFVCECGCLAFVHVTAAAYAAADGAWLDGHRPAH